jgi:hypothetical protein
MMRPAARRRRVAAVAKHRAAHRINRDLTVGEPRREFAQPSRYGAAVVSALRNGVGRYGVRRRRVQRPGVGGERETHPCARFGVAVADQRERALWPPGRAAHAQREIAEPQPELRAVGQRMGDKSVELLVPAEVGVAVVRPRRQRSARQLGQPLHGAMRLKAGFGKFRCVDAAERSPGWRWGHGKRSLGPDPPSERVSVVRCFRP